MPKTEFVKIRLSETEKEGFETAADQAGMSLSAWMRERLRREVIPELEEASKPISFIGNQRQQKMAASKFHFDNKGIGEELLRQGRLTVPPNQRSYAWEDRHVESLLQDLADAISNDDDEYFLGTIVLIEPPKSIPLIADGR